eukprot:4383004-Amphidinium_carterae.1
MEQSDQTRVNWRLSIKAILKRIEMVASKVALGVRGCCWQLQVAVYRSRFNPKSNPLLELSSLMAFVQRE